jgi:hypothetical protein
MIVQSEKILSFPRYVFFTARQCSLCVFKQSKPIKGQSVRFVHRKVGGALFPFSPLNPGPLHGITQHCILIAGYVNMAADAINESCTRRK